MNENGKIIDKETCENTKTLHERLSKHILAAGMDPIELDLELSRTPYLYDAKNDENWLDFGSFFASSALGMNHPALAENGAFLDKLLTTAINKPANSDFSSLEMVQFIETFSRVMGDSALPHLFFIEGGAAAVENALKVAFDWKQQHNAMLGKSEKLGTKVLHLEHAFHGRSGYTLSLTNTDPVKIARFPKFDWPRIEAPAENFSDNDNKKLEQLELNAIAQARAAFIEFKDDIACFIAEPIQGEGGDRHLRAEFLLALQNLCIEFDALFILDEIQSGGGITGTPWAYQQLCLQPDIVVFGKKIQVCGIMAGRRVDLVPSNVFCVPSRINSTWGGNLTDMVRATRILEVFETENLFANADFMGSLLLNGLQKIAAEYPEVVFNPRGRGLMCAISFKTLEMRDLVLEGLARHFIIILGCGGNSIRFRPPLCIDADSINFVLEALRETIAEVNS
jgi:L-lysine 6-transaminase